MRTPSADFGVANHGVGADAAGGADARLAENLHERFDHGVGGDFDIVIDHAGRGIKDGDAFGHELLALVHAHLMVDDGEFGAGVGAENFAGVFRFPDHDALSGFAQNSGHVGEVILAVRIGGGKLLDVRKQLRHSEDVESGIDLVNLLLCGAGGFFFDDGLDFGTAGILSSDDASVAGGMVEVGAEQSHGGLLVEVEVEQAGDGLRRDLRSVAGEDDDMVVGGECRLRNHQSVAGAALLCLQDEVDAGMGDGGADAFGFVTDDGEDVCGRHYAGGGGDDMASSGLPPTSCRTLGSCDLSRVPLPAAMMATATRGGESGWHLRRSVRSWISSFAPLYLEPEQYRRGCPIADQVAISAGCGIKSAGTIQLKLDRMEHSNGRKKRCRNMLLSGRSPMRGV